MTRSRSLRMAAALVLLLATVVFVIGITTERSVAGEATELSSAESSSVTDREETESESEEAHADEAAAPHDEANEASEMLLGINPESTGAIAAAVAVSVVLAAALWFWESPAVLIVVAVFAPLFAALDLREVAHQLSEARSGLAAIALLAAALHVGVAVIAGFALMRRDASIGTPALV